MSSDEIAIRAASLGKCYQIYDHPQDRLKQSLVPRFRRLFGQPAPNYFHEFWALRDVSIQIRKGETVGIVGRNGSGKSTLLQIICGTLTPTTGMVETTGRVAALLELGAGFNPEFTGRENVYLNGSVLGLSQNEIDERFDAIAGFADIGDFIDQSVKTYSSGMVVRLGFAVAINADPEILIVDEALAVGDELFQRKCFSRIEAIKNNGATILFVSHSAGTVVELCDRGVLMDGGEVLIVGTPKSIVGKYQRLIYAPEDKRFVIRDEIKRESNSGEVPTLNASALNPPTVELTDPDATEEFFDPSLVPQSTIAYEARGAVIHSPHIMDLTGALVNCLRRGRTYRYVYDVRFESGASNVRFGMLIKSLSGVQLGGGASAATGHAGISYIAPGTEVRVEFRFLCALNTGSYFFNAGVQSAIKQEEVYLHRILDSCMFRVLPEAGSLSTGIIDFACVPSITWVSSHTSDLA